MRPAQLILSALLSLAANAATLAQTNPYAGEQARSIKALSDKDLDDLLAGRGAGFAKAAELNGYPGPAHTLELKEHLSLTAPQVAATEALMARHKASAQAIGAELVAAERALDEAFASHRADAQGVTALTATVARYQGELRAEHLRTHLAQTALLTPEQIGRYARLRGYAQAEGMSPGSHHH